MLTLKEFKERAIAIDTEYKAMQSEFAEKIEKVWCVAWSWLDEDGVMHSDSIWTAYPCQNIYESVDYRMYDLDDSKKDVKLESEYKYFKSGGITLEEISKRCKKTNPIFICHSYEGAERKAFKKMGDFPERYEWYDTYHTERLLSNNALKSVPPKGYHSLVECIRRRLGVCRDTEHKEAMRFLCISGATQEHESEIMAYCEEDTKDLIPLAESQIRDYVEALKASILIGGYRKADPISLLLRQVKAIEIFCQMADFGIPVSPTRCDYVKKGAKAMIYNLKDAFSKKYKGSFVKKKQKKTALQEYAGEGFIKRCKDKSENPHDLEDDLLKILDGKEKRIKTRCLKAMKKLVDSAVFSFDTSKYSAYVVKEEDDGDGWRKSDVMCQGHLAKCILESGIKDYPLTASGRLKMDTDTLEEYFKDEENFGGEFYKLNKICSQLSGIQKGWMTNLSKKDGRLYYQSMYPFRSLTGRCQPHKTQGYVFGWTKFLYGIIEPPKGKMLVELDFSSEETAIQAALAHDKVYEAVYKEKDIYMAISALLGKIPKADYQNLSQKELKEKYHSIRKKIKTFTLAWSYGAGERVLAARSGMTIEETRKIKDELTNKLFIQSTKYKQAVVECAKSRNFKTVSFPDGFICRVQTQGKEDFTATTINNLPFQGFGSYILREVVLAIADAHLSLDMVATVHDAIVFLVDEDDYNTIEKVKKIMAETADSCLKVDKPLVKVGEPEVVHHGEVWTPEHEQDAQYFELEKAGRKDEESDFVLHRLPMTLKSAGKASKSILYALAYDDGISTEKAAPLALREKMRLLHKRIKENKISSDVSLDDLTIDI